MVDIVVNHYFWAGPASSVSYSTFNPFNSATYFHPFCSISQADYDNNNQGAIENCWLGNEIGELPDLNTENAYVVSTFNSWISSLVSNYSIDGLRVDTVKHVPKSFWPNFNTASRVYNLGEVYHGDPGYTCPYQNYMDGVLNFPLYYSILDAFRSTSGSISSLVSKVNSIKTSCKDSNLLGSFTENHDIPRLPSYTSDLALLKNAIAFGLLADGVPIIYSGQESLFSGNSDPYNREALWSTSYSKSNPLYGFIALINQLRNIAISRDSGYTSYKSWIIYSDTTTLVTRKGSDTKAIIAVFSNKGSNGAAYTQSIPNTGYTSGTTIVEILGCTQKVVNSDGSISVDMAQGALRVFYPKSLLSGSGVCGN